EEFSKRVPDFPSEHLLVADFFKIEQSFDLIIEQTFFCALDPSLRDAYVQKMKSLLKPNGKLVGLMFNAPMNTDRPPYGGTMEEYKERFKKAFGNIHIIPCKKSIKPREGNEVWIEISND
ncbi:MAG: SAM-dependent methyltransferase, partial [Flavobacteriales bacterium]|nr:SAM-dependent methyltransferase [Flavobacteriales bacterium]